MENPAGADSPVCAAASLSLCGCIELRQERSYHSDTILHLRKIRIVAGARYIGTGHDVNFITKESEWRSGTPLQLPLNRSDMCDRFTRVIGREWLQFGEILTMVGQANRNNRHRCNRGM